MIGDVLATVAVVLFGLVVIYSLMLPPTRASMRLAGYVRRGIRRAVDTPRHWWAARRHG